MSHQNSNVGPGSPARLQTLGHPRPDLQYLAAHQDDGVRVVPRLLPSHVHRVQLSVDGLADLEAPRGGVDGVGQPPGLSGVGGQVEDGVESSQGVTAAVLSSFEQCGPLSLIEVQRGSALIGRELHSVATPVSLMP